MYAMHATQTYNNAVVSASLYVSNLRKDITKTELFEVFNRFGPILSLRFGITQHSCYAYIDFQYVEHAEHASKTMNFSIIRGQQCRVINLGLHTSQNGTVLIKNLHENIDDKVLYDTLSIFGNILDCKVIIDTQTGKSKSYGYVYYVDDKSAMKAIEGIHGMTICGHKIEAEIVKPTKEDTVSLNICNVSDEQKECTQQMQPNQISLWLTNDVKLPEYIDLFIDHGVDDMETVQLLSIDDIRQEMGITNIEHIDEIMKCIDKLNEYDAMQEFAMDIDHFITSILPNKQEINVRKSMFKYITDRVSDLERERNLKQKLKNKFIRMNACQFGSSLWSVACRGSDIDIAITVNFRNFRNEKQELLDDLLQIISGNDENGLYIIDKDYIKLLNATYPIVRIKHKLSLIEMDISIADRYCIPTNKFILQQINIYSNDKFNIPMRNLIIFIKYWSKQRGINNAYHQYLNSFGYTMMVINYVKYHVLQNKNNYSTNLIDLIYGFFKFYVKLYDFDKYTIDINKDVFIKKYGSDPMEIIDPMKDKDKYNYNVARKIGYYQRYNIIDEFQRSYGILKYGKDALFQQLIEKDIVNDDNDQFTNIYIKYIPSNWNEKTLKKLFEKGTGGKIVNIEIWKHDFEICACLTFESSKYAKIAIQKLNDKHINSDKNDVCKLYVVRAQKIKQNNHSLPGVKVGPKCNLYVSNLNVNVDEFKLYQLFVVFGKIISTKVIRDTNGRSKGYGFVAFNNSESATKAINTNNNTKQYGTHIHVSHARNDDIKPIKKGVWFDEELFLKKEEKEEKEEIEIDALTSEMLLDAKPEERKRLIGERLFPKIQAIEPKLAVKILSMLLYEMDNTELLVLLSQQRALINTINEALAVLENYQQRNNITFGFE